ncbi:DnaJ domain-containing protein [Cyanobium sp. NIES-981]|uniref:DnaJ domain-containing protein n=1 Tax=Cyanobium sp. NIES-981 TaxID=1851505 RepID=UPI0007DDAE87|nr:DnaJ domain-containing protein [Cyanobium sp. NIES-981]SBO42288.1 Heat shock protein DnaJ, N-terminal domain protein [Cyanobium sp. NIES-981]
MAEQEQDDRRQISLRLPEELISRIDALKGEFGCRSRGAIVERLLQSLLATDEEGPSDCIASFDPQSLDPQSLDPQGIHSPAREAAQGRSPSAAAAAVAPSDPPSPNDPLPNGLSTNDPSAESPSALDSGFDERGALVLRLGSTAGDLVLDAPMPSGDGEQAQSGAATASSADPPGRGAPSRGIDLPGFVQRRTDQLRRSLHPTAAEASSSLEPLPQVPAARIASALAKAEAHWHELYGQPANPAVLEAAMLWMAQDVWPQSDQSEGRPFTWSLASAVMRQLTPDWPDLPPSFGRVMVTAGVLEDPFSSATLELRIPTLIRRFVHRFRRRRPGATFQTLEHTMTLHGALKLLELPTDPGQRLTLPQIREAYREMALAHHPDAGGSEEAMRRLNEAYQLLKELYRTP